MGDTIDAQGTLAAHCDDLAIEEEERLEMERAIAAISATAVDSPLTSNKTGGDAIERDQYTAFAPVASAYSVEHTSTGFKHAIWKMDTFNHLAPISIRALQFLGNVTDEQVTHCRTQILKGKLKFCGRVILLDPQDLKFPSMRELDPDKCRETNSGMWQKGIRQDEKPELRILRKVWSVDRLYLKCKCKKEKSKDCGDTPLWFDHEIWYLLAHPDILFPGMSSIKIRTSMLIHYLRTTWREGVIATISFHFLRDLMLSYTKALEEDATLNAETVLKEDRLSNYPIPMALARILLPTRIPEKPTRVPLSSPRATARKRNRTAQLPGQSTLNFQPARPATAAPPHPPPHPPPPPPPPPPIPPPQQPAMAAANTPLRTGAFYSGSTPINLLLDGGRQSIPHAPTWLPVLASVLPTIHPLVDIRGLTPPPVIHISPESSAHSTLTQAGKRTKSTGGRGAGRGGAANARRCPTKTYDPEQFPCRARRYADMRSNWSIELLHNEGCTHVITLDSSITDNPLLQGFINTGLNHIPFMALDVEEAMGELERFQDNLFAKAFFQEKSLEVEEQYGVRPNLWWAIASMGEFHANLPKKVYSIFTADITRCFEAIPTDNSEDSLPAAIIFYVQSAMQIRRERSSCHTVRIRFGEKGSLWPSWVDNEQREEMGSLLFKEGDICWIAEWCIANSLLRMGDFVWRQVRGIPMGLVCSPIWCDIYFFKYEFHAMMRLADRGNAHLIPYFEGTFRYIDKLGAINNAVIRDFLRGSGERDAGDPCWIYPDQFIEIKENTEVCEDGVGRIANFLSMTITVTSPITGTYIISKHDKRAGRGFSPCRFMKYKSNRSTKQSLQIITAQVAQIFMICSEPKDAANEIAKVVQAMVGNGFAASACWKVVKKTLRNAYLYQPGRLSVHMIREALANLHGIWEGRGAIRFEREPCADRFDMDFFVEWDQEEEQREEEEVVTLLA
ncbi:hypothetical protein CBR_g25814 [Chara braunii]|uniref:Uncharacterized protein n=1 Tax=Chara braunii TaxID=69332 RepID=A0A388L6L6_CHABU|nr:hypothetical protein CBR_g25814 [Chara braunii]|eukprot:GBG77882.1 hypothetical protein CBR_g25814 [Chara braunii]